MRSPNIGHSLNSSILHSLTDTSIRDCLHLALDLVVTLAKFLLVLIFSLEDTLVRAYLLSQQPSLRAFSLTIIHDVFPLTTQSSCTLVGSEKPVLDTSFHTYTPPSITSHFTKHQYHAELITSGDKAQREDDTTGKPAQNQGQFRLRAMTEYPPESSFKLNEGMLKLDQASMGLLRKAGYMLKGGGGGVVAAPHAE